MLLRLDLRKDERRRTVGLGLQGGDNSEECRIVV